MWGLAGCDRPQLWNLQGRKGGDRRGRPEGPIYHGIRKLPAGGRLIRVLSDESPLGQTLTPNHETGRVDHTKLIHQLHRIYQFPSPVNSHTSPPPPRHTPPLYRPKIILTPQRRVEQKAPQPNTQIPRECDRENRIMPLAEAIPQPLGREPYKDHVRRRVDDLRTIRREVVVLLAPTTYVMQES